MKYISIILATWMCANLCGAQEIKPYPRPNITAAQWQSYFEEVKQKHGASLIDGGELLTFRDPTTRTSYHFTKPGHPAHPAWITRRVDIFQGGAIGFHQVGHFAGAEPPFIQMNEAFWELNRKITAEMMQKYKGKFKGSDSN